MRCSITAVVLAVFMFVLCSPARAEPPRDSTAVSQKWTPWSELVGAIGKDGANRGEVTVFAPLQQGATSVFFAEIRGKLFDEDVQEANLALGFREMQSNGWNLGAWAGFDMRNSEEGNSFYQIAGGLEALNERWDARLNGYVPITDPQSTPGLAQLVLAGNRIFMTGGEEMALYGFDGEIGYRLLGGRKFTGRRHELRVYGGGFYFDRDDAVEKVAGPRARLEWRIDDVIASLPGSRLTLEAEYSNDHSGIDSRADRLEVGARLRLPLGGNGLSGHQRSHALTAQEQRMTEGIERDIDIVTQLSEEEPVEDAQTDVHFDQVAYADGGTGLNTAIATGDNTLIIADGGNGTIAGNVTLGSNQTLQGGASTIPVRGRKSGTVVNFTAPGSKPTVQTGGNNDVITVGGNNVHIAGLTIDGDGQTSDDGVDIIDDKTNIVVDQNMFQNIGEDGFDADFGNSNVRILNNMFANIAEDAIDFEDSNTDVTISGNTINVPGSGDSDGIELAFFNSDFTITNNVIVIGAGNDADGIDLFRGNSDVTISGNTITSAGNDADGVELFEGNRDITITGNTISTTGDDADGVELFDSNLDITISGNTISTTGDDADAIFLAIGNGLPGVVTTIISNNLLSATGIASEALDVGIFNVIEFSDNRFTGAFDDVVVDFDVNPNIVNGTGNTILPGATFTNVCEGIGNFTGTLEIIDNSTGVPNTITIVNAGVPCT